MAILYERLGNNIRTQRKKRLLTQRQLAEMLGCSSEHLSHIENGVRHIQLDMLDELCHILSVSYEDLLQGATDTVIVSTESGAPMENALSQIILHTFSNCSDNEIRLLLDICQKIIDMHNQ